MTLDESDLPVLHSFLSGTSLRLLPALSVRAWQRHPYMHSGLARDYRLAEAFFEYGPKALRNLRLRHALAPGAVHRSVIQRVLAEEVERLVRGT